MNVDVSALIVSTAVTGIVGYLVKLLLDMLREYTESSKKWRKGIDECIMSILEAQCTQMRSDITHKVHRYMDDLGAASEEEKQSLRSEYELYCVICAKYGIKNHFVEQLVQQVMELPDRV